MPRSSIGRGAFSRSTAFKFTTDRKHEIRRDSLSYLSEGDITGERETKDNKNSDSHPFHFGFGEKIRLGIVDVGGSFFR